MNGQLHSHSESDTGSVNSTSSWSVSSIKPLQRNGLVNDKVDIVPNSNGLSKKSKNKGKTLVDVSSTNAMSSALKRKIGRRIAGEESVLEDAEMGMGGPETGPSVPSKKKAKNDITASNTTASLPLSSSEPVAQKKKKKKKKKAHSLEESPSGGMDVPAVVKGQGNTSQAAMNSSADSSATTKTFSCGILENKKKKRKKKKKGVKSVNGLPLANTSELAVDTPHINDSNRNGTGPIKPRQLDNKEDTTASGPTDALTSCPSTALERGDCKVVSPDSAKENEITSSQPGLNGDRVPNGDSNVSRSIPKEKKKKRRVSERK